MICRDNVRSENRKEMAAAPNILSFLFANFYLFGIQKSTY